jgi:hypothetical protein
MARNYEKDGGRKDAHCPRQVQGSSACPASRARCNSSGLTQASLTRIVWDWFELWWRRVRGRADDLGQHLSPALERDPLLAGVLRLIIDASHAGLGCPDVIDARLDDVSARP